MPFQKMVANLRVEVMKNSGKCPSAEIVEWPWWWWRCAKNRLQLRGKCNLLAWPSILDGFFSTIHVVTFSSCLLKWSLSLCVSFLLTMDKTVYVCSSFLYDPLSKEEEILRLAICEKHNLGVKRGSIYTNVTYKCLQNLQMTRLVREHH